MRLYLLCFLLKIALAIYGEKYYNLRKLFGDNMKHIYQNPD